MGQILYGCATTTAAHRRAIQNSQESLKQIAAHYHINVTHFTVLTAKQEAMIVAFRLQTRLPLDDCLYALQPGILNFTRSSLHRSLKRHSINRLPEIEGDKPVRKKFAKYPIGYLHMDISEVCTKEERLHLFVAIDPTSKFTYAELHSDKTRDTACRFLRQLIAIVPYRIHTILTDNGIQFTNRKKDKWAFIHLFDRICRQDGIEHRLTKVNHPWTNGQVERLNRTLKEATVKRCYDETHEQLKDHLKIFLTAYNFARRLKTLNGLTAYEYIVKCWQNDKERFKIYPNHDTLGLST